MTLADTERLIAKTGRKAEALLRSFELSCPHCGETISPEVVASVAARRAASMRTKNAAGPGRPKKLRPCPQCGVQLGAAEFRKHRC